MASDTGIQEADVKHYLRKSAAYLFHSRRIAAVAHRSIRRPASQSATCATSAQRIPGCRQPTAT
ncbi:hypothetical protein [Cupriavidus oxalaticus]|uniref:Uncharacterized protein n=1 Tax=Cupriavidus oxalaticus TaxID=96344 RepID=A0A4V1BZL5_9BURK|nr:hypothetical protein [Cupriavidus oxalaticus]QBY55742.1 hypothetical protein E0W60_32765 [Cupriavidus oxalaticus]